MSLRADDLDVLRDLAGALGLVDASGSFQEDWLSDPGRYLSEVLADPHQRESLVEFVDEVLGGDERTTGPDGSTWLPIVERSTPDLKLYLVLDDRPASSVAVGVGVRFATTGPQSSTTAHVPLFRVAKKGASVPSPFLLGTADAVVTLTTEITVDPAAPVPGQAHLGGLSLLVSVPTGGGASPRLALLLRQLQLPGAQGPRDLTVDAGEPGELEGTLLDLVLGLVRAQAEALPPGALTALAGLLGLRDGVGVPPLPVEDLASDGVVALASWLESVVADPASRAAWIGQVADLLGGTAVGDAVRLNVGAAVLTLGVRTSAGADGHTRLTPTLAAQADASADAVVRAEAELCTIDLGGGSSIALPSLSLQLVLGHRPDGGTVLLDQAGPPAVRVEAARVGFALDAERRPTFVLAADRVTIGSHTHATLDLSSPDAVADAGGVVLGDVADEILNRLGPAADAVRVLLGLSPPAGHPGVPTLAIGEFLQNPLGAVAEHWRIVVRDHAVAIPALITTLRDLVADAAEAGRAVEGAGTEADPWRVPVAGPVALQAWASGERLSFGPAVSLVVDTLGERCTSVETDLRVVVVEIDLAGEHVAFLPAVDAGIRLRARVEPQLALVGPAFVLTADAVELRTRWTPVGGLHANLDAPNLALDLGSGPLPAPIPKIDAAGHVTLDAAGWNAVEALLAAFAQAAGPAWLSELAGALGWVRAPFAVSTVRLSLAELVTDPPAALRGWLGGLAVRDPDLVVQGLSLVSRVIGGTHAGVAGIVEGSGRRNDPWLVPLSRTAGAPRLAAWIEPGGPRFLTAAPPTPLQTWRPGLAGLSSGTLAAALREEAVVADDIAALLSGRPDVTAGLDALVVRWAGTDGRVVPPDADPAGIGVERRPDATVRDLPALVDVEELLGRVPETVVRVAVSAPDALPWAPVAPERVVDLTTAGLAPAAFTFPAPSTGEWHVALGGRAAARLATGDTDGTLGQAERLRRFLDALGALPGGLVVVAEAAAGHAARQAADAVAAVTDLVLLGTPLGPVSFTVLDTNPPADTLRLLARLLPSDTDEVSDDPDLALGRGLVDALGSLLPKDDPALELRPPTPLPGAPRAGLTVRAVFGVVDEAAVRRGLTAIVAAGLAERAQARATQPPADPNALRFALRVPIPQGTPAVGDVVLDGYVQLDLAGIGVDETGPHVQTDRSVALHAGLGRLDAWLVGGPDPGRAPGVRPEQELRRVSLDVTLPAGEGAPESRASLTLHEPRAFGIVRERWVVQPVDAAVPPGVDAATSALPEVRVLLSGVAEALGSAASGPVAGFAAALQAVGILDPDGGSVPDAVDHLLHDAAAHLRAAVSDAASRRDLVAALRSLFSGVAGSTPDELRLTVGTATIAADLAASRVTVEVNATPGEFGLFTWSGRFVLEGTTSASGEVTIGEAGTTVAGGIEVRLAAAPLGITLRWHRPGLATAEEIPLWPSPDADALARALARVVLAELARFAFEIVRDLDASVRSTVDAALSALGLLGPAAADGSRRVPLPVGLLTDPVTWFSHASVLGGASGFDAARLIALLDAFKPLVGVGGGPGEWALTPGVVAKAEAASGGAPRLSLTLDTSQFASIPGVAGRLTIGGAFSLSLSASGPSRPGVDVFVGLAGSTAGREAVHVAFGDGLAVFLRPAVGADLPLYPTAAGLGQLAETAITQALPLVLDRLAALAGDPGVRGQVGTLVVTLGDALGLRSGGQFDGAALRSWAADPVAALAARLPALSATVLGEVADAIRPLLPGAVGASVVAGALRVEVGDLAVVLSPSPFSVAVTGEVAGLTAIQRVGFGVTLESSGLKALDVEVGPAKIDAGGVDLRPFAGFHAGSAPVGGRRAEIALGLGGDRRVGARFLLGDRFDLVVVDGGVEEADPQLVAVALLEAVLDIVASFAIGTQAVTDALAKTVGSSTVRNVLRGVLLNDADPSELDDNLFDPAGLLGRLQRLAVNLGEAAPSVVVDGGFRIGLAADDIGGGQKSVGLRLSVTKPVTLVDRDLTISLEADARWIRSPDGPLPDGIVIDALRVGPGAGAIAFEPGLSANGIGLRFGKESGPILDVGGVSLGSVALHLFGRVGAMPLAGGVELQLSDLAVGVAGASGGNPVAQGIMSDAGQGGARLAPKFSPALAVQKHGSGPVLVSLRAGEGTGPWWLALQKGFGPLYIEQVGFGVTVRQDQLERISLLLDGRVSLLGLTAAVDDLQLTFVVASDASVFDSSRWAVDLAGLAISSDIGGITLQGGLRKFGTGDSVQYVGMLLGRFGVYGLSVFGGYGQGVQDGQRFASFFAFGAVNGPIGGPPAFFVTGIGGGLGINRALVVPSDLSQFDQYPFIKALDPGAQPNPDPMAELTALSTTFPMERGSFWFAAGLSFNSFALVDGVAVVSVQVGDGLQIALLGLARMALPRPEVALVSIEMGLVARFSSKEGVLWVQAQLTDNSWLLYPDVRLTGGFAFVTWFAGPNRGQFVLTIGGYHPRFHRDGYPEVPRLGLQWRVTPFIAAKGEAYFALTSEALMAGGRLEIAAELGPAWAHLVFAADGIVFFDPFRFEVEVYARISAGVTIDFWFAEVTFSISIGARILVSGPQFHGKATFSVGPVGLSLEFGDRSQTPQQYLPWAEFVRKYLEESSTGVARVVTAIPGKGALPPGTGPGGATDTGTADGSAAKPFTVYAEFEIMVTTAVPSRSVNLGGAVLGGAPSRVLGIAPMGIADAATTLRLNLVSGGTDFTARLQSELHRGPGFPVGVWGPPQADDDRKVPAGDVIDAIDGIRLFTVANIPPGLPPIDYRRRVETGKRHPLPFVNETGARPDFIDEANDVAALLPPGATDDEVYAEGAKWMSRAGNGRTALAAIRGDRSAPPRFGSLTDGLAVATAPSAPVTLPDPAPGPVVDANVHPPVAVAVITTPLRAAERPSVRTSVRNAPENAFVTAPPTLERVVAATQLAVPAQLHRLGGTSAPLVRDTVVAEGAAPLTRLARGGVAAVAGRGAVGDGRDRLAGITAALSGVGPESARARAAAGLATIAAGEIAVLRLPNAERDIYEDTDRPRLGVSGGPARVVALGHGGEVLADTNVETEASRLPGFAVPRGAERLAVAVAGEAFADAAGLAGWHAATELAYIGWSSALAAGAVVRAEGGTVRSMRQRRTAGFVRGAELVAGTAIVVTRFVEAATVVVVALDDPVGTDAARGLSLGLAGAERLLGAEGSPRPPRSVVRGNRTFLVYEVRPTDGTPVVVTVASQEGWSLAGVMGGKDSAVAITELLATRGIDAVVRPVLPGALGSRTFSWLDVSPSPASTMETGKAGAGPKQAAVGPRPEPQTPAKATSKTAAKAAPKTPGHVTTRAAAKPPTRTTPKTAAKTAAKKKAGPSRKRTRGEGGR